MTYLKELFAAHFALIFGTAIGFAILLLIILAKIFHELRTDPKTKQALKEEARFVRAIIGIFKKDAVPKPGEPDPLAETTREPFKAVKRPSKIEDEEGG